MSAAQHRDRSAKGICNMPDKDCAEAVLSVFDRIYVLNLPHRRDRRREMEAELARIGLSFAHPSVTLFPAIAPADPGEFPSLGARGCFESHLAMHRAILASGARRALILEDDASFARGFAERFADALPLLRGPDWDLLYSVQPVTAQPGDRPLGHGLLRLSPEHSFLTTHFLGVSRAFSEAASSYLDKMRTRRAGDPYGGPMHVDGAYVWMRKDLPDLGILATELPLATQRSSRSDIAGQRLHHRLPLLRDAVAMLRRLGRRA